MNSTRMDVWTVPLGRTVAVFAAAWAALCQAEPSVTVLSLSQDASSRRMAVEYRLEGGPAIVTAEVLTNGVPVPLGNGFVCPTTRHRFEGVNCMMPDGTYKLYWQPTVQWPGHVLSAGTVSVRLSTWANDDPPPYMGIDLTAKSNVVYFAGRESV